MNIPILNLRERTLPFPARHDAVSATWIPLYMEPMVGSGERFCFAVAVANSEHFMVVPVVAINRLDCLYGKDAEFLQYVASETLHNLEEALQDSNVRMTFCDHTASRNAWEPPFEGVYAGDKFKSEGNSLAEIARMGLTLCASLVERLSDDSEQSVEVVSRRKLESQIKNLVVAEQPKLGLHFNRFRRIGIDARQVTFGFAGQRLAANFGVINPSRIFSSVESTKAKLWDLGNLHEDFSPDDIFSKSLKRFEMLVHVPYDDDPTYTERQMSSVKEAINELTVEAEKKEILFYPRSNPAELAARLIKSELDDAA